MNLDEAKKLKNGLYRLYWKEDNGGGSSLASVGRLHDGTPWFAASNWTHAKTDGIASTSWGNADRAVLISRGETKHTCDICCPTDLFEKPVTMSEALDALKVLDPSVCRPKGAPIIITPSVHPDHCAVCNLKVVGGESLWTEHHQYGYVHTACINAVNAQSISDKTRSWFEGLPKFDYCSTDCSGVVKCTCGSWITECMSHKVDKNIDNWILEHYPHRLITFPTLPDGADSTPEPIVKPDNVVLDILRYKTNKNKTVLIKFKHIEQIYSTLGDAREVIRAKYPDANHAERKGMKLMMDELSRAGEICLEIIRQKDG